MRLQLRKTKKKMICQKKFKWEGPIAAFFKRGQRSTPKNAGTAQKNVASERFYGPTFKTRLFMNSLSCVFKKHGFSPSGAVFL